MSLALAQAGRLARAGCVLLFAVLLQACGGGGGGNGSSDGNGTRARVSADTTNVTWAVEPGDSAPASTVNLTITNPPKANRLYMCQDYTLSGITGVDSLWPDSTQTRAQLLIGFRLPGRLRDGTYEDQIEVQVGTDRDCNQQITGSPVTINTHYTVSGGRVVTIDRDAIEVEVDGTDPTPKRANFRVTLDENAEGGFYIGTEQTSNAVSTTNILAISQSQKDVEVVFKVGDALPTGVVNDTMTIRVCYVGTCEREVQGSPFTVSTQARVTARAEPGVTPMPYLSRVVLPHDVVDAEFDRASNALVMVSRIPSNAIYVYDVATGLERSQSLAHPPMAVSLAPDGLTAAVGHDAFVSIVALATVGQMGAAEPVLLDLSTDVFDIVLDGNGFVHVFPLSGLSRQPRSIEIASNTETLAIGFTRPDSHARLHPGGQWIYSANNHSSPSEIEKLDVSSGVATALYDSPYHGDYEMCGNLWFSEDGETIYTACGNAFRSSATQAEDMTYIGGMELTPSDYTYGWRIHSLSESVQGDEIALIEDDDYACDVWPGEAGPCYSHFALYERQSLNKLATYSMGLATIDGFDYAQRGMYVFHDATNGHKYVIGRAVNSPDPLQTYFLSVVE
ncbi:MAG TPA: hypothetical protein VIG03_01555 [Steroidobacteraceae bacterium]|jgi:hypothetical protein